MGVLGRAHYRIVAPRYARDKRNVTALRDTYVRTSDAPINAPPNPIKVGAAYKVRISLVQLIV